MSELKRELRRLFSLAFPLAAAEAGTQVMSLVDMAVIGRLGGVELAAAGLANAVYFGISVFGVLGIGRNTSTSNARPMLLAARSSRMVSATSLYLPAAQAMGIEFMTAYRAISWLAWVPNLMLAEFYIRGLPGRPTVAAT